MSRISHFSAPMLALFLTHEALADGGLDLPEDEPVLTISGAISKTNAEDGSAIFDRSMLEALGSVTITTTTPWTDGPQTFTGVPLGTIMEHVRAEGATVAARAINDYVVDIPAEDWGPGRAIVAYRHNGEEMSLREKGPLWVVYPFDSHTEMQSEVIYSRAIWQLESMVVKD